MDEREPGLHEKKQRRKTDEDEEMLHSYCCSMGSPKFYEEVTGGYTVAGWITQMLETGLSGLPNVGCTDCDTKPDYLTVGESCD